MPTDAQPQKSFFKVLGPGLLFAGTSVGVSELIQSTRAGADYSFALLAVVVLACALKYPAFAFGPWYAHATGVSLLEGFRRQGKWALGVYLVVTLGTVFTVQAVVTLIAASLLSAVVVSMFESANFKFMPGGLNMGLPVVLSGVLLAICAGLLKLGRYKWLDTINKFFILLLTISTLVATVLALTQLDLGRAELLPPESAFTNRDEILRITGLIGWTPSAYDVAVWHSLWFLAHKLESKHTPALREARLEFNIGYWFSSATSVCFLILGACMIYHVQGAQFRASPVLFATDLINLYVRQFGEWSRPVIGICAFSAMFSTVLVVTDSFPRVLSILVKRFQEPEQPESSPVLPKRIYWIAMGVISTLALLILAVALGEKPLGGGIQLTLLIDIATTLSFLSAPVLGVLIHRAMFSRDVPDAMRPGTFLRRASVFSIGFSALFASYFLWLRFLT
ncbi:MAG: divalent metal cation transporter [Planctomycetes bacterium]|nr:divalent metal cation transporter [Planctomycetota bacterium]